MRKVGTLFVCLLGLLSLPVLAGGEKEQAIVGKPAPDFALKDTEGKEVKLSDFKGKVVVLEWINHECPVVNQAHDAKQMTGTLAKFKDEPVVWLGIDSSWFAEDKKESITKWMKERKIEYPILLDAPGKVGQTYEAKTTPHMFVIDQKGVLAYAGAIDNKQSDDDSNPRNYVEEAVSSLLKGSAVATTKSKPYGCSVKYKK